MSSPRLDVRFRSGDDECAAWLYRPDGEGPFATVVLGHGLGAVREMRLAAVAERFRDAGYACLVFDYRHFGDSGGEPRQLLDVGRQRADWRAAIACARSRPELDPDRVIAWGSSFGGGHAIVTAADDPRLAAAIAQCPFTSGSASARAADPRALLRLTPRAVRDQLAAFRGAAPVYAATAGPPGGTAFMTAPDAESGYLGLVPDGVPFRNEIAARLALTLASLHPGRRAKDVACPILFTVCERDSVAPAGPTLRYAAQAPRGEVDRFPGGHFEIYDGEGFERVIGAQLAFLARHVPVGRAARVG